MPKSKKETTMVKDDIRHLEDLTKLILETIVATKTQIHQEKNMAFG